MVVPGLARQDDARTGIGLARDQLSLGRLLGGRTRDQSEAEVERARRYGRNLGLVMLRASGPSAQVDAYLRDLVHSLRRMDLLAEYGGEELALLLPEADRDAIDGVIARARYAADGVIVTCGGAAFPSEQTSAGEMIGHARQQLHGVVTKARPASNASTHAIVVQDPGMQRVMTMVKRVAPSSISVLLYGESGVGKDVVATAIHENSARADRPFVRLDCGALPEALFESELFGHVAGAFTGAVADKAGRLESAHTGTLFLDGIGSRARDAGKATSRARATKCPARRLDKGDHDRRPCHLRDAPRPRGGSQTRSVSRRLYFRISAFAIPIPPLRDRRSEIAPLAHHFIAELARGRKLALTADALEQLVAYDWPGNVRELRNAIERAIVLGGDRIEPEHLPDRVIAAVPTRGPRSDIRQKLATVERQALLDALMDANGKQNVAAKALRISRFALSRLMEKHGIKKARS